MGWRYWIYWKSMSPISCKIVVAEGKSRTAAGFDESLVPGCSPAGLSFSPRGNSFIQNGGESTECWFRGGYLAKERENLFLQRQRGSFWSHKDFSPGCHNKQLLIEAALAECKVSRQQKGRDVLLQDSCYLKATSNCVSCCVFPSLDPSRVSSVSVGRGHPWTETLASHSAAWCASDH